MTSRLSYTSEGRIMWQHYIIVLHSENPSLSCFIEAMSSLMPSLLFCAPVTALCSSDLLLSWTSTPRSAPLTVLWLVSSLLQLLALWCTDPVISHTHCWVRFSFTSVQPCTFLQINNTKQSWGFLGFYYEWNTHLSIHTHTHTMK